MSFSFSFQNTYEYSLYFDLCFKKFKSAFIDVIYFVSIKYLYLCTVKKDLQILWKGSAYELLWVSSVVTA